MPAPDKPLTIDDAYGLVRQEQPDLVHISGKTCTGKTTLAAKLKADMGYEVISLDDIVREHVISALHLPDHGRAFNHVYKLRDKPELTTLFLKAARNAIDQRIRDGHKVIIDGAVANVTTLAELLDGYDHAFLYIHPRHLDAYTRNLTSRFKLATPAFEAGLPLQFWDHIDKPALQKFFSTGELSPTLQQNIREYAIYSQASSAERLKAFQQDFDNIKVVII